ncbi:MAG: hypothetical protein SFU85_07050 [Candidatus Methylacidiphilales bacterium]|nr:hypothetical protein [Candidatus Methylacidiphilales bacterium]
MTFDDTFAQWLDTSLSLSPPDQVNGFSFNLTNIQGDRFAIELIGASRFDEQDPDWACDELWQATPRQIEIPAGALGTNWTDVLEGSKQLIARYLNSGKQNNILKAAEGIAVGFVDGDLIVAHGVNAGLLTASCGVGLFGVTVFTVDPRNQ